MMRESNALSGRHMWHSARHILLVAILGASHTIALLDECSALMATVFEYRGPSCNVSEIQRQKGKLSARVPMRSMIPQRCFPHSHASMPFLGWPLLALNDVRGGSDSTEGESSFKKEVNAEEEKAKEKKQGHFSDNEANVEDSYADSSDEADEEELEEEELVVHQAEVVLNSDIPRPLNDAVWNPANEDREKQALDAKRAESREVQSGAYRRASFLWLALALDVILTKSKRQILFGALTTRKDILKTLGQTTFLSTSFGLAAALAYLLLTTISRDDDSELSESYSKTWNLSLALFSLMNLMTYITMGQPFMGLAAAGIHVHNFFVSLNGWTKGFREDDHDGTASKKTNLLITLMQEFQQGVKSIFGSVNNVASLGFAIAAISSLIQGLGTVKGIRSLAKSTLPSEISLASILMVQYATLARRFLNVGIFLTLAEANGTRERSMKLIGDQKFMLLHFAVAITSGLAGLANILQWLIVNDGGLASVCRNDNLSTLAIEMIAPLGVSTLGWLGGVRGIMRRRQLKAVS